MNKKFLFILILIFLSYIFNIDKFISNKITILNINIKENYIYVLSYLNNFITKHFNQEKQIINLQNKLLEKEKLLCTTNIKTINTNDNILSKIDVLSYIDFSDFSKVILKPVSNVKKISALITKNGYSAGIIKKKGIEYIGYLNHNPKSNYAVYIGKNNAPGITHGIPHNENIKIKFIPLWQNINIGDKVITSGMDNIFPYGIKVGYVSSIKKLSTTQEAFVKPYAKVYSQKYFYILNK